jgi:prolyl-tRNA editing enzyme YbaK/EbsC (Cys-tRNA(Pro) deacylase)
MSRPTHPPKPGGRTTVALTAFIEEHRLDAEIVLPGVPVLTVPQAAAAIGAEEDQILKTLLFHDRAGRFILVIASGTARVDRERLATVAELDRPRMADAATVLAITGYPAGAVPPVAHLTPLRVIMDTRTAALDIAYGGGGSDDALLRIRPADILRLTGADVADVTEHR